MAWGNRRSLDTQGWGQWLHVDCKFAVCLRIQKFIGDARFGRNRGYTGHEHIDSLGLIHMNGRIYDPHLGPVPCSQTRLLRMRAR